MSRVRMRSVGSTHLYALENDASNMAIICMYASSFSKSAEPRNRQTDMHTETKTIVYCRYLCTYQSTQTHAQTQIHIHMETCIHDARTHEHTDIIAHLDKDTYVEPQHTCLKNLTRRHGMLTYVHEDICKTKRDPRSGTNIALTIRALSATF